MMTLRARSFLLVLAAGVLACDDPDATPTDLPPRSACALAVVASDYRSTAVSLLTADGERCAPDVITSGSRPPGLLTALSGDVVLPSAPLGDHLVRVLDRYPNAVLTTLAADSDDVLAQLAVSPGYASNPQDVTMVGGALVLARMEHDDTGADGGDLWWPADGSRLALDAFADAGKDPMPTRFARATDGLWVGLTHLARDFSAAGPGRVLGLSDDARAVVRTLDLPTLQNCGTIAAASDDGGLWVVCSGLFRNASGPQIDHSGIAWLARDDALGASPLSPSWVMKAVDLHATGDVGRPLGFTLAPLDEARVLVVALGDLESKRPDRLLLVDRTGRTGPAGDATVLAEGGAFELGGVLAIPDRLVLVADADPKEPRLRRFTWPDADGHATELAPVTVSPTGLPPRHVARFR